MTTYLLDANVLIALTIVEHEHHDRVARWAETMDRFALCPVVEGALIRYLLRIGEGIANARAVLDSVRSMTRGEFWPDALSYRDADLGHVQGHSQVTDAYLASLARSREGLLATLDESLARIAPDSTLLIPV